MLWRMRHVWSVSIALSILFIILMFRLLTSLDQQDNTVRIRNEEDICSPVLQSMEKDYKTEIEDLRQEIHQLSMTIASLKAGESLSSLSPVPYKIKLNADIKLKTEVYGGYSYINEKAVDSFTHFTMWNLYPPHSESTSVEKVRGLKRKELDQALDAAIWLLNNSTTSGKTKWRRDQFVDGIYRRSTSIGTHYEMTFCNDENRYSRVTVFSPESTPFGVQEIMMQNRKRSLNIVIPLSSERLDSFQSFLRRFQEDIIAAKHHPYEISLTMIYFGKSKDSIKVMLQSFVLKTKYKNVHIEYVTDRNFSRGYALDLGVRSWTGSGDPVLFFCDVDIVFGLNFLRRCMAYSDRELSAYFPIVFSLYNPGVIENYFGQTFPNWKSQLKISSDHGFWRYFGYGMACMYRSDYVNVGGFDTKMTGWGDEDVDLFRKFARSNLTAYRASDPDIYHLWHQKTCDRLLTDDKYRECIKTKAANEGSHMQLAYLLFKDEIELRRKSRERL